MHPRKFLFLNVCHGGNNKVHGSGYQLWTIAPYSQLIVISSHTLQAPLTVCSVNVPEASSVESTLELIHRWNVPKILQVRPSIPKTVHKSTLFYGERVREWVVCKLRTSSVWLILNVLRISISRVLRFDTEHMEERFRGTIEKKAKNAAKPPCLFLSVTLLLRAV